MTSEGEYKHNAPCSSWSVRGHSASLHQWVLPTVREVAEIEQFMALSCHTGRAANESLRPRPPSRVRHQPVYGSCLWSGQASKQLGALDCNEDRAAKKSLCPRALSHGGAKNCLGLWPVIRTEQQTKQRQSKGSLACNQGRMEKGSLNPGFQSGQGNKQFKALAYSQSRAARFCEPRPSVRVGQQIF